MEDEDLATIAEDSREDDSVSAEPMRLGTVCPGCGKRLPTWEIIGSGGLRGIECESCRIMFCSKDCHRAHTIVKHPDNQLDSVDSDIKGVIEKRKQMRMSNPEAVPNRKRQPDIQDENRTADEGEDPTFTPRYRGRPRIDPSDGSHEIPP